MNKRLLQVLASVVGLMTLVAAVACGGGDGTPLADTPPADENRPPVIDQGLSLVGGASIAAGESTVIQVGAVADPDQDALAYTFSATRGKVDPAGPTAAPQTTYTAPSSPGQVTVSVNVSDGKGGVATASLQFVVVVSLESTPDNGGGPSVEITDPADDSTVPSEVLMEGTASNLDEGTVLWSVVHIGGLFWPQREALLIDEEWSAQAFIGAGSEDSGKKFDLLAVSVDSDGTKIFTDWLDEGERTDNYPGFSTLPPNSRIGDRITVTLE